MSAGRVVLVAGGGGRPASQIRALVTTELDALDAGIGEVTSVVVAFDSPAHDAARDWADEAGVQQSALFSSRLVDAKAINTAVVLPGDLGRVIESACLERARSRGAVIVEARA